MIEEVMFPQVLVTERPFRIIMTRIYLLLAFFDWDCAIWTPKFFLQVLMNILSIRGVLEQGACLDALISVMLDSSANQTVIRHLDVVWRSYLMIPLFSHNPYSIFLPNIVFNLYSLNFRHKHHRNTITSPVFSWVDFLKYKVQLSTHGKWIFGCMNCLAWWKTKVSHCGDFISRILMFATVLRKLHCS